MPTAELVNPFEFDLFRARGENVVGFTVRVGAIAAQSAQVYVCPGPGMFLVPLWFQATFAAGNTLFVGYASRQSAAFAIGNNVFNLDTRAFGATVDRTGEDPLQMAGAATWGAGTLAPFFAAQNFMRLPPGLAQPGIDRCEDELLEGLGQIWIDAGGRWFPSDPVHFEF